MGIIDDLLNKKPFELEESEKKRLFLESMKQSIKHHYRNCKYFQEFLDFQEFNINSKYMIEELPFLPVSIFKELELITGDEKNIRKKVLSSSTSGDKPSLIFLDSITIARQRKALVSIMSNFLGDKKRIFFVFDSKSTVLDKEGRISSRASAIRGISIFAKTIYFLLDEELELDKEALEKAISSLSSGEDVCFFGFTWIIYNVLMKIKLDTKLFFELTNEINNIKNEKIMLHIGGWKKLQDISVDKQKFNKEAGSFFGIQNSRILDFYGMTEQLGTVYPDCEFGYKHVPLYSEIILRNLEDFRPCSIGETGFIQLLSPIPNSYPGISIISDDLGEIKGVDDCKCGRKGKYFVFKKRVEKAELKGCGDTYDE